MDIGFLLFSSMLNPTELYLSKEFKNKPKAARSKINKPKVTISKTIDNKISLFRKKAAKESSLDSEIETAIEDIKNPEHKNIINELLTKEITENFDSKVIKYRTQTNKIFKEIKSAFKNLYGVFVGYVKSAYKAIEKKSKILNSEPDPVGYMTDIFTLRLKIIRAPLDTYMYMRIKLGMLEFINPMPKLWY